MYCWSCGEVMKTGVRSCATCGAEASLHILERRLPPVRMCPACGYRGDGIPYFRRAGHAALLLAATVFTYGVGGLVYWFAKRNSRICPSCGLAWERAHGTREPARTSGDEALDRMPAAEGPDLPGDGLGRRVLGVLLALVAVLTLGMGILAGALEPVVVSVFLALSGAGSFAWGWRALQRRREALLRALQRKVLRLAERKAGRLSATEVASELGLSLAGAERVLFHMDDGFRVRSDVTDDGLLLFEFPEIRLRGGPEGKRLASGEEG